MVGVEIKMKDEEGKIVDFAKTDEAKNELIEIPVEKPKKKKKVVKKDSQKNNAEIGAEATLDMLKKALSKNSGAQKMFAELEQDNPKQAVKSETKKVKLSKSAATAS